MIKKIPLIILVISIFFISSCNTNNNGTASQQEISVTSFISETSSVTATVPEIIKTEVDMSLNLKKIEINVDYSTKLFTSNFNFGITHTHYMWEDGEKNAVLQATDLIKSVSAINNQHIMGWGAGNPWPSKNEPMDFSSLDSRIDLFRSLGGEMCITFCQAPGWMKGSDDWVMEKSVKDEYVEDFAFLCAKIAERYPDVKIFQVWNEFKGYWSSIKNEWDYERYTVMYNAVYKAVKEVRPDAKIGGFYLVVEGDGSRDALGINGTHDYTPLSEFQKRAVKYWYENAVGADYLLLDRGNVDYHNSNFKPTEEQAMA